MVLTKFTLSLNDAKGTWDLRQDSSDKLIKRFDEKGDATRGGVLRRVVGPDGGSVKIQKMDHHFQEERTYPRSKDPKSSKG